MQVYNLLATTMRVHTDRISLSVEAATFKDAIRKTEEALDVYPKPHSAEGVHRLYVEHRDYGDVDIMDIREIVTDDEEPDDWPS